MYRRHPVFVQFLAVQTIWISIALVISRISWNFKICNIELILSKTRNRSNSNQNPMNHNNNHLLKWNQICNHKFHHDWWPPSNSHSNNNSYYSLQLAIKYQEIITKITILIKEKHLFQLSNNNK